MPITRDRAGNITITGDDIRLYDVMSFRTVLSLEIRTGMNYKAGFSVVKQAIRRGYVADGTRSKRKAYGQIDALAVALGAKPRPLDESEQ